MSSFGLLIPFLPQLEADWLVCGSCGRKRDVWYCVPLFAAPLPGCKQEEGGVGDGGGGGVGWRGVLWCKLTGLYVNERGRLGSVLCGIPYITALRGDSPSSRTGACLGGLGNQSRFTDSPSPSSPSPPPPLLPLPTPLVPPVYLWRVFLFFK